MSWSWFSCCCKVEPDECLIQNTSGQPANYGAIQPVDGARAASGRDQQGPHPQGQDNQAAVHGNGEDDQSRSSGQPTPSRGRSRSDSREPQKDATTASSSLPSGSAAVEGTKTNIAGSAPPARRAPLAEEAVEAGGGGEKAGLGEGDVGRTAGGKGESVKAARVEDKGEAGGDKTVDGGAGKEGKGVAELRTKDGSTLGGSQEKQGETTPGGDAEVPLTSALFPDAVASSVDEVSLSDKTVKNGGPAELEGSGETLKASDVESSSDTVK